MENGVALGTSTGNEVAAILLLVLQHRARPRQRYLCGSLEHTEKHKSQITIAQIHTFCGRIAPCVLKKAYAYTNMCNLHKSWSTRDHVDQGSQMHKSSLHKSKIS